MQILYPVLAEIGGEKLAACLREHEIKIRCGVDGEDSFFQSKCEDMTAAGFIFFEEMEMITDKVDSLDKGGAAEPGNSSPDILKFKLD